MAMTTTRPWHRATVLFGVVAFAGCAQGNTLGVGGGDGDGDVSSSATGTGGGQIFTESGGGAQGGSGAGGSPACSLSSDCDDADACTIDACTNGLCEHADVDLDDGDACTMDTCTPGGGVMHLAMSPDDGDACTVDACDPTTGVSHTAVDPDDGDVCTTDACDPVMGVSHVQISCDDMDACTTDSCDPTIGCQSVTMPNLALSATGLTSGGGSGAYGPTAMHDGIDEMANCNQFTWISNGTSPSGAYFELDWPSAVTIGSMFIETSNKNGTGCYTLSGRNLKSATVQYWNGSSWVTSTSWSGQADDVQITLPAPVTTTKIRLYDVTTDTGNGNSLIFEWFVYAGANCTP